MAEFMCSSRSLRYVEIDSTMHDVFYSVLANKAVDSNILSKLFHSSSPTASESQDLDEIHDGQPISIETLFINSADLSERPYASHDLAQFICKMPHLKELSLGGQFHDDFYSTSSSMASSAKIETLHVNSADLSERPYASHDLAQFICKMLHLKNLSLDGQYHDDFYSTSSSMASSAKIEILKIASGGLSKRPSASRDLAQFICKMPDLNNLKLRGQYHDDFYSTSSSMASSAKIETLDINSYPDERPSASRDLAQFICKMQHLKNLTLGGQYHNDFYSTSSSMASSAKIETLDIKAYLNERPSASRDLAQFICKMPHLNKLKLRGQYHDDYYSKSSSMATSAKIETLDIKSEDLDGRPSTSHDIARIICKMPHLKNLTLDGQFHDDFYSTSSSMASSAKIETLRIVSDRLSKRLSASRDLAQFICKMPNLNNLTIRGQYHDDFYSTSSSMASSAKIETLDIWSESLRQRRFASRDLAQFIFKMPHLKNLTLRGQYHDDFYSASSSIASTAKIETLVIWSDRLRQRRSASRDLAQLICKMPQLKTMSLGGQYRDDFYSTLSSMASSTKVDIPGIDVVDLRRQSSSSSKLGHFISKIPGVKRWKKSRSKSHRYHATSSGACAQQDEQSGNRSPTLTELTVGGDTLEGWQDCGSMFDNVKRVTIQVRSTINYDVFQMIHLPGATELTIQTYEYVRRPADFHEDPTSLPNGLLHISPQLVKVTFSDLDIGNNKMGQILLAFRSPHNLKDLKTIRFIRCRTDESMDDFTSACNKDRAIEVEVEHGKPRGESLLANLVDDTLLDLITKADWMIIAREDEIPAEVTTTLKYHYRGIR